MRAAGPLASLVSLKVIAALALLAGVCACSGGPARRVSQSRQQGDHRPLAPRPLFVLDKSSFAYDVVFLPQGQVACGLMEEGSFLLAVYDAKTGERRRHLPLGPGQDWLFALAVQPGPGRLVAAAFRHLRAGPRRQFAAGRVVLVDLLHAAGRQRGPAPLDLPTAVRSVAFLDDRTLVLGTEAVRQQPAQNEASSPLPGTALVCVADIERGILGCAADHGDTVSAVIAAAGGVASGSWDRTVRLRGRDLVPGSTLHTRAPVNALAVARSRLVVATSQRPPRRSHELSQMEKRGEHQQGPSPGDAVEVWDLDAARRVALLRPHLFYVTDVALSADGGTLASASWDWSVALIRRRQAVQLRPFSQIPTGLSFSPGGELLAVSAWTEHRSGAPSCLLLAVP